MQNVNTVVITGNLTRDPELRYLERGDEHVCKLRVAVNGRRKDADTGAVGRPAPTTSTSPSGASTPTPAPTTC